MNKAILVGRLTADPELQTTNSGVDVCRFSLAINRPFKSQNGENADRFSQHRGVEGGRPELRQISAQRKSVRRDRHHSDQKLRRQ